MGRNTSNIYKASINILGSCIIRDAFFTQENDGGYKIFKYVNLFSPLSVCEEPIPVDVDKYESSDFSSYIYNYRKRCIFLDFTRDSVNYIKSKKTDWLIIDCALLRRNLYQIGEKKLTCLLEAEDFFEFISKNKIIPKITGKLCIDDMSDEELKRRLQFYVDEILSIYPVEKIVLVENKNADLSYDGDKEIDIFLDRKDILLENQRMLRCFNILKDMLKGCHIIPVPDNLMADSKHRLGKAPVHYTQEYYDYIFKAFECIQEKYPKEKEENIINQLCNDCNTLYMTKYYSLIKDSYVDLKFKYSHSKLRNFYTSFKDLYIKYIAKKNKRY